MRKKAAARIISAVILSAILASLFFVISFANDNDFSYPSATATQTVYADALLERLDVEMIEEEKAFLRTQSGFALIYNSNIPTSYVSVSFDEENEKLTVTAREYIYTAKNGISVVWSPVSATLEDEELPFSDGDYTVIFNTPTVVADAVDVKYEHKFTVPKEEVNRILNLAYNSAPILDEEIKSKNEEYERLLAEHIENVNKYALYIPMLEAYNEYLKKKNVYDAEYKEYSKYLDKLIEYEKAKEEYEAYLAAKEKYEKDYAVYLKYLAYAETNQSKIEAYEKYQEKLSVLRAQLSIIASTKTKVTDLNRTIYDAIMGNTVTSVIENKDLIANQVIGASSEAIDRAGAATENLRVLMKEFFEITGEKAQYNYYITNYDAFRNNFLDLFQCLDKLYMNSRVRGVLISQDKQEKYIILLAQLYYISNALSDEPIKNYDGTKVYDESYIIGEGYTDAASPSSVITETDYLRDTDNASPLSEGYPTSPPKPDYVTMEEPTIPTPVKQPIAPEPQTAPIAPEVVLEPEKVEKPGKEPEKYLPPDEVVNIITAYNEGRLFERSEILTEDLVIDAKINVSKKFRNVEEVTVIYYGSEPSADAPRNVSASEENSELYRITVDKGTYADYMGIVPVKEEDAYYFYHHSGWTDSSGNDVNLLSVENNLELYPKFEAVEKPYKTHWVIEGEIFNEEPEEPKKEIEGAYCFDFAGWEKQVDSVTLDITYTAIFEKHPLLLLPDGKGAEPSLLDGVYSFYIGSFIERLDVERLVYHIAGKGAVSIKTIEGDIYISYAELLAMKNVGVKYIDLSVKKHSGGGYSYRVDLYDEKEERITKGIKFDLCLPCDVKTPEYLFVYYISGNENKVLRSVFNEKNKTVAFTALSNETYYAKLEYTLTLLAIDGISISANKTVFDEGEEVILDISLAGGMRLDNLYVIYPSGEKVSVAAKFEMPATNLVLGIEYTVLEYTVIFVSDGKTIASYLCNYGDVIEPPEDPKKAADTNFKYTFIGWSEEITPVTENKVYEAEYMRTALPQKDTSGLQIAPEILKLLTFAVAIFVSVVFIVIPSGIMTIIVVKKRKKHLLAPSRVKK